MQVDVVHDEARATGSLLEVLELWELLAELRRCLATIVGKAKADTDARLATLRALPRQAQFHAVGERGERYL